MGVKMFPKEHEFTWLFLHLGLMKYEKRVKWFGPRVQQAWEVPSHYEDPSYAKYNQPFDISHS